MTETGERREEVDRDRRESLVYTEDGRELVTEAVDGRVLMGGKVDAGWERGYHLVIVT